MAISRIPIFENGVQKLNQQIEKDSGVIELPEPTLEIQNLNCEELSGAKPSLDNYRPLSSI